MRNYLLAGISAIALLGAGAVHAANDGVKKEATGVKDGYASELEKKGYDTQPDMKGTEMQHTPQSTDSSVREGIGPQGGVMHPMDKPPEERAASWRDVYGPNATAGTLSADGSQSGQQRQEFRGQIMRGDRPFQDISAEELLEASVADSGGNKIGEVEDLLVGSDGNIRQIVVGLEDGGTVAMDMSQLELEQGSAGAGSSYGRSWVMGRSGGAVC